MKELKLFTKDMVKPFVFLLVVCFPILFFNVFIDPYKVLLSLYPKTIYTHNLQFAKINFLRKNKTRFDSFIFGSSRVGLIDPQNISGAKYYNMTYTSGTPAQHFRNIKYLLQQGVQIKNLLIGIDYLSFLINSDYSEDLLTYDYPVSFPEKLKFYKSYILLRPNWDFAKYAFKKSSIDNAELYKSGIITAFRDIESQIDNMEETYVNDKKFSTPATQYFKTNPLDQCIIQIDSIVRFSKRNNINLRIFINPTHYITYLNLNHQQYFKALRKLSKITDFYDFSGLNSVTLNNCYYYETSHFRLNVGDMMISRIFNQPNPKTPDDFGQLVTMDNVESQIHKHEIQLDEYFKCLKWPLEYREPASFDRLRERNFTLCHVIESINGIKVDSAHQSFKIETPLINIKGWAIDQEQHKPAKKVFIEIDGMKFETNYGISGEAFDNKYNDPVYLNSGWEISIPAKYFTKGKKSLSVDIVLANGREYIKTEEGVTLNILYSGNNPDPGKLEPLGETSNFAAEKLNGQNITDMPMPVTEKYLNINGWGVDDSTFSPAGGIIVSLDSENNSFLSNITFPRPDIDERLNLKGNSNVGWGITIPCAELTQGMHKLTFKVLNNENSGYYKTDCKVFINISKLIKLQELGRYRQSDKQSNYAIDNVNGQVVQKQNFPLILTDEVIEINGWAYDSPNNILADGIYIKIDDLYFKASYGINRDDVGKYFKNDKIADSGWNISIPVDEIGKGNHIFAVIIVSKNDSVFYNTNSNIPFLIK